MPFVNDGLFFAHKSTYVRVVLVFCSFPFRISTPEVTVKLDNKKCVDDACACTKVRIIIILDDVFDR